MSQGRFAKAGGLASIGVALLFAGCAAPVKVLEGELGKGSHIQCSPPGPMPALTTDDWGVQVEWKNHHLFLTTEQFKSVSFSFTGDALELTILREIPNKEGHPVAPVWWDGGDTFRAGKEWPLPTGVGSLHLQWRNDAWTAP